MSTSLDEDLVILENLDFDLICQMVTDPCDRPASWILQLKCCSAEYSICEYHRAYISKWYKITPRRYCVACNFIWFTDRTDNLIWTRL